MEQLTELDPPTLNTNIEFIKEEEPTPVNTTIEHIDPIKEEEEPTPINITIEPIEPIKEEEEPTPVNITIEPIEPIKEEEEPTPVNITIEPIEPIEPIKEEEEPTPVNITIEHIQPIKEEEEPTPVNITIYPTIPPSPIIEYTDYIEEENIQFNIINHNENVGIDELKNTVGTKPIIYDPPIVIFIVPYRDREEEKRIFNAKLSFLMEDYPQGYYQIYYIQQNYEKPFNRGAMKNIGFLMIKQKYPQHYKNITLVFNDIDTTPLNKTIIRNYSTTQGIIKHFYGYDFILGGIVSITAGDFEYINGFPNYYAWGFEDNELNDRANRGRITIDRSVFYLINDNVNIIQIKQSPIRIVNSGEYDRFTRKVNEGINTIYDVHFTVNETTGLVDVTQFKTVHNVNLSLNRVFDSSKSKYPFITGYSGKKRCKMNLVF